MEDLKKEFEEKFELDTFGEPNIYKDITDFFLSKIDELLKSQREELLEKIEGMKKNMTTVFYDEDGYTRANAKGYNQALSDIQAHIKSLIGEE